MAKNAERRSQPIGWLSGILKWARRRPWKPVRGLLHLVLVGLLLVAGSGYVRSSELDDTLARGIAWVQAAL